MIPVKFIAGFGTNLLSNIKKYDLSYLVEASNWVTEEIGISLSAFFNREELLKTRIGYTPFCLFNQIVHFGSDNIFFGRYGCNFPHSSNRVVLTWFHIFPEDKRIELLAKHQKRVDFIHVTSAQTAASLMSRGINKEKIVIIPLGVDLSKFGNVNSQEKIRLRKKYGIQSARFVIGSFQKDGVGWGEGFTPKLIKGPDVFVKALLNLKKYQPYVLLTGPARGYVKRKLAQNKIDFKHIYVSDYKDIAKLYQTLDLYLVSSRVEGGPMAIVESMACGVPLVSTKVGMAPDVIVSGHNGYLAKVDDVSEITKKMEKLILDAKLRKKFIDNGLKTVVNYDSDLIARSYYEKIYQKLS